MKCTYFKGKTIYKLVKSIRKKYIMGLLKPGEAMVISIKNSQINDLPIASEKLYIKYFTNMNDQWFCCDGSKWYFSFYRRLIATRGNVSQFYNAIETLMENQDSRRCVLLANDLNDSIAYRPALISVTLFCEDGKINMITHWRSQELFLAFPMNTIVMCYLLKIFVAELQKRGKNLSCGSYLQYVDRVTIHHSINKKCSGIKEIWKKISRYSEKELRFFWGIVEKEKEDQFDAFY